MRLIEKKSFYCLISTRAAWPQQSEAHTHFSVMVEAGRASTITSREAQLLLLLETATTGRGRPALRLGGEVGGVGGIFVGHLRFLFLILFVPQLPSSAGVPHAMETSSSRRRRLLTESSSRSLGAAKAKASHRLRLVEGRRRTTTESADGSEPAGGGLWSPTAIFAAIHAPKSAVGPPLLVPVH